MPFQLSCYFTWWFAVTLPAVCVYACMCVYACTCVENFGAFLHWQILSEQCSITNDSHHATLLPSIQTHCVVSVFSSPAPAAKILNHSTSSALCCPATCLRESDFSRAPCPSEISQVLPFSAALFSCSFWPPCHFYRMWQDFLLFFLTPLLPPHPLPAPLFWLEENWHLFLHLFIVSQASPLTRTTRMANGGSGLPGFLASLLRDGFSLSHLDLLETHCTAQGGIETPSTPSAGTGRVYYHTGLR